MQTQSFGKLRSKIASSPQSQVGTSGLTLGQDQGKSKDDSQDNGPSDSTISNAAQAAAGMTGSQQLTRDQLDTYEEKVEEFKNKPFLLNNPITNLYTESISPMAQYQQDQQKLFKSNDDLTKQLEEVQKKIEELQNNSQPNKTGNQIK
jgi:phage shock protein A